MDGNLHLTSSRKGRIAEAGVLLVAERIGWDAYLPTGDGARVDMVLIDGEGKTLRTQVKWGSLRGGVIRVRLSTSRFTPSRGHVRTTYDAGVIDAVAVWCDDLAAAFLLPIGEVSRMSTLHLRVNPAANSQVIGVRYASDYLLGAVAQLGERSAGSRKVRGSSPLSST